MSFHHFWLETSRETSPNNIFRPIHEKTSNFFSGVEEEEEDEEGQGFVVLSSLSGQIERKYNDFGAKFGRNDLGEATSLHRVSRLSTVSGMRFCLLNFRRNESVSISTNF